MNGFILAFVLIMADGSVQKQIIDTPAPTKELCEQAGEMLVAKGKEHPDEVKDVQYVCVTTEEYLQFKQAITKGKAPSHEAPKEDNGGI